jgi:hypothetical protein
MKISVIIPAYNAEKWLRSSVASVQKQTRRADEIIVVDDGSTDGTPGLCRELGEGVRYMRRENGGLSAARNSGVAMAKGDWFLFLDADDVLYPDALEMLSAKAQSSGAEVVYGFVLQRGETLLGTKLHSLPHAVGAPPHPAEATFWWTPISTAGCALISRALNERIGGFDEAFRQVEDAEYWLRCGVTTTFAHTGTMVLDKTYSADSLGQQRASSIWYRLQLQMKFLTWCRDHDISTDFLGTSHQAMVNHALTQAWRNRKWELLAPLLSVAWQLGVVTPWCIRAAFKCLRLKMAGSLPPEPNFCRSVHDAWRNKS